MKKFYIVLLLLFTLHLAAEAKSIKIINISTTDVCPDKVYSVRFKPDGYASGAELKIFLSESNGAFDFSGYSEGSVTIINNDTSTINLTIPKNTPAGNNYKIVMIGEGVYSDTLSGIKVHAISNPNWLEADSTICDYGEHTYRVDSSIPDIQWTFLDGVAGTDYQITQNLAYQKKVKWLTPAASGRRIKVVLTNANGCSETLLCTVKVNPLSVSFSTEEAKACWGTISTYEMTDKNLSYTWSIIGGLQGMDYTIKESVYEYRRKIQWNGGGTYKVIAKAYNGTCYGSDTCVVTVPNVPEAYNTYSTNYVFCEGSAGSPVIVSWSQIGYKYELMKRDANGVYQPTGVFVNGTGNTISFPNQTAGIYKVRAIEQTSGMGCSIMMHDSVTLIAKPKPTIYNVKGGGDYCEGGAGVPVWLEDSQTGVNYQLYLNGSPVSGKNIPGDNDSLSFGNITAPGTYTVKAKDPVSTCEADMAGSVTVSYSNISAFNLTGGGDFCEGDPGKNVSVSNSEVGAAYQLYRNGVPVGTPVAGTGSAISFGNQTEGNYTVKATKSTCERMMNNTIVINKLAKPQNRQVLGSGDFCEGDAGKAIQMPNSDNGVIYQLYKGGVVVATQTSTGGYVNFGTFTEGDYTVRGYNSGGCEKWMTDTVKIRKNPLPQQFNVASSGSYCQGDPGIDVSLSGSQTGVTYYLFRNGTDAGANKPGTGSALAFGKKQGGTYTIKAVSASGCVAWMNGSAVIVENAMPTVYNLTGSGRYCAGSQGVKINLSGSEPGVKYVLLKSNSPIDSMNGNGSPITFGYRLAGVYTVKGVNGSSCEKMMNNTVTITEDPLPTAFNVTGSGKYCSSGDGLPVDLSGSQTGVTYQLYKDGTATGSPISGTGSSLTYGKQLKGVYTVKAVNATTGCEAWMNGSAIIDVYLLPSEFTISPTGTQSYCEGSDSIEIKLPNSELTVDYYLYKNNVEMPGAPKSGTGSAISFGKFSAGTYKIKGKISAGCERWMAGELTITVNPLPNSYALSASPTSYCEGENGVTLTLQSSQSGVNYQLYKNGAVSGSSISGSGSAITYNNVKAGSYWVIASTAQGCSRSMKDTVTIIENPLPTAYNVQGGGSYCQGDAGLEVKLSGSQSGVNYQLKKNGSASGTPVAGNGSIISFGLQKVGVYTVEAVNPITGCSRAMNGSATIDEFALPVASITGNATVCENASETYASNNSTTYAWSIISGGTIQGANSSQNVTVKWTSNPGKIQLIQTNAAGCSDTVTQDVVVNELPTAVISGQNTVCENVIETYSSNNAATYAWTVISGGTIQGSNSSQNVTVKWTSNPGKIQLIQTNTFGCADTVTQNITVNPLPVATITGAASACENAVENYSSNSSSSYEWTMISGGTIQGSNSSQSVAVKWTSNPGKIQLILTNSAGCADTVTKDVAVNPLPVATITGASAACENSVENYSSNAASTYAWSVISGGAIQGASSSQNVSIVWTSNPGKLRLIQTNASGCADTVTQDVTVNPLPVATITGAASACENSTVTYASNSSTNYKWSIISGGSIEGANNAQNVAVKWTSNPGKIQLIQTNEFGCADTVTQDVTVNPLPVATITGPSTICENSVAQYASNSSANYVWNIISGGTIQGSSNSQNVSVMWTSNPGKIQLIQTNASGCSDTVTQDVTVNPLPVAAITGKAAVCEKEVATYASNAANGNKWRVISGGTEQGGSTSQNYSVKWASNPGKIELILTNPTGCADTVVYDVVVNPLPTPSITGENAVCSNSTITYTSNSAATYVWTVTGGAIIGANDASTVKVKWTGASGSLKVVQTNASGCSDSATINITINPTPDADITGAFTTCQNSIEFYTGTASANYKWTVEGGVIVSADNLQNAQVLWQSSTGKLTLIETNSFGCADTVVKTIVINPKPDVAITGDGAACKNSILFYNSSLTGGGYNYEWTASNGQIVSGQGTSQIAIQWNVAGTGSVKLIIANSTTGCRDTASIPVLINPLPDVTITGAGQICSKQEATYQTGLSASDFTLDWKVVTGGVLKSANGAAQITVQWNASGVGELKLVAINKSTGCKDSLTKSVIVNPTPTANITGAGEACSGATETYSTNSGVGQAYVWTVNGGTIVSGASTPTVGVKWNTPGSRELKVVVENASTGCRDSAVKTVIVNPLPTPQIAGTASTCGGSVEKYYRKNSSNGSVEWKIAGGAPLGATNVDTLYVRWGATGSGKLTLIETAQLTGCKDSVIVNVQINPLPTPEITGDNSVCAGDETNYSTNSVAGNSYSWQINGGTIVGSSDVPSVKVIWGANSIGKLIVKETASTSGCVSSDTLMIDIHPNPTPTISGIDTVCLECSENYYGAKPDPSVNSWRVEKGEFETPTTGEQVTIRWKSLGKAKLILIQTNEFGCVDTAVKEIVVIEAPKAILSGENEICEGTVTRYTTTSSTDATNIWSVTGGQLVDATGGYYIDVLWNAPGAGEVKLIQRYAKKDYVDSITKSVQVYPKPNAEIQGSGAVCMNSVETYRSVGSNATMQWTVPYGGSIEGASNAAEVKVRWTSNGAGKLDLVVTSVNGCRDTATTDIIINSVPASQILGSPVACAFSSNIYHAQSKAGTNYEWSVEGGEISETSTDQDTVEIAWKGSGMGIVRLVQRTAEGCSDTSRIDVTIYAQPVVTLAPMPDICVDAAPFKLTGGKPEGGKYAGKGVISNGIYDPSRAGVGIDTLTYLYVDANKCSNSSKQVVRILPSPPKPTIIQAAENLVSSADEGNQWLKDGILIPGAINKIYSPTATAWYSVYVTAQGGCVSDTSDAYYYEPGNEGAQIMTTPGVSFGTLLCETYATQEVLIENLGVKPLVISKAEITGQNYTEFKLLTDLNNITIEPKNSVTALVAFAPTCVGSLKAYLEITSNAKNGAKKQIPLTGVKDSSVVTFSASTLVFDGLGVGETAVRNVTVYNTGTVPFYEALPNKLGEFEIVSPKFVLLEPGDSVIVTVKLTGVVDSKTLSEKLIFTDSCDREDYVLLTANLKDAASARITVTKASGNPGDIVTIPITLDEIKNFAENGITEVTADVEMTASLLEPVEEGHVCQFEGVKRLYPIKFTVNGSGPQTYNMKAMAMLGTDTVSALVIRNVQTKSGKATISTVNSEFKLEGVCREGGPRLVKVKGNLSLMVKPNPISDVGVIELELAERGSTKLHLANSIGQVVRKLMDYEAPKGKQTITVDFDGLASGVYFLVLETPTAKKTVEIQIVK